MENREVLLCVICGKKPLREGMKTCSHKCSVVYLRVSIKAYKKAYQKTDKYKAYHKAYYQKKKRLGMTK